MQNSYLRGIPWKNFMDFISPGADRYALLKETIEEAELEYTVLDMAESRHFLVTPVLSSGPSLELSSRLSSRLSSELSSRLPSGQIRQSILVAHYDRAAGSPGANDNSAGVFLLIETAMKLKQSGAKNWMVAFTDKEELKSGESIQSQGAYALALGLKNTKMQNSRIFSFDSCGIGDTLIISTTAEHLLKNESGGEKMQRSLKELRKFALDTARELNLNKVLLAPTPFSDDLGFFRAGLAALTITMLPSSECIRYVSELRRNPEFAESLINAEFRQNSLTGSIPETWRSLNTPGDSHIRLTPKNFRNVIRFAENLCKG